MPQFYKCYFDSCNRSFQRPANLKRHIQTFHGADFTSVSRSSNFTNNNTEEYFPSSPPMTPERSSSIALSDAPSSPRSCSLVDTLDEMSSSSSSSRKRKFSNNNASLMMMMLNPDTEGEDLFAAGNDTVLVLSMLEAVGVDISSCSSAGQERLVRLLSKSAVESAVSQRFLLGDDDTYRCSKLNRVLNGELIFL